MQNDSTLAPFLKWAGGKRWLASRLSELFQNRQGKYFEPFLGSAAVFFRYRPRPALLSDSNVELIECYRSVRDAPNEIAALLARYQDLHDDDFYYVMRDLRPDDPSEAAARFLYLNRTCWNGLYRVNRQGVFNVPRGTKNAIVLPTDNFEQASILLKTATLVATDFEESIRDAAYGDLIFADPPYTVAHNNNGFLKYNQTMFSWADQLRLAGALGDAAARGARVVVTNANHEDVWKLYSGFPFLYPVSRHSIIAASAVKRKITSELLITNFALAGVQ